MTKGQDSATSDIGSTSKKGNPNPFEPIDLCAVALELGASFVARSFSGDKEQLVPLLKAAMSHKGFALLDIISPCVTFNDTPNSTKSYQFFRDHREATGKADFVPFQQEITADYEPGFSHEITLHDGSSIHLYKETDLDVADRGSALRAIRSHKDKGNILTGLLYIDPDSRDFHEIQSTIQKPLRDCGVSELCPGSKALDAINDSLC